jgi:hypothetical protein
MLTEGEKLIVITLIRGLKGLLKALSGLLK